MVGCHRVAAACFVLLALAATAAGCGSAPQQSGPTTEPTTVTVRTVAPTTRAAPTTARPTTTTTTFSPTAPQASPDGAAAQLVAAWGTGDRAAARTDASAPAVATLFAIPYPGGELQDRGCTDPSVSPGTCTYRNLATDGLYEISVTQAPAGWYVSSVIYEA
jgi:hypothetical protein